VIHNLVEEHVRASYESLRPRFPEFCGCDVCREDAMVYTLNRVPPRYVATRQGSVLTEVSLEKDQSRAAIDVAMMEGLRKIALAPRCDARRKAAPG
jgi:competence protein ComFB